MILIVALCVCGFVCVCMCVCARVQLEWPCQTKCLHLINTIIIITSTHRWQHAHPTLTYTPDNHIHKLTLVMVLTHLNYCSLSPFPSLVCPLGCPSIQNGPCLQTQPLCWRFWPWHQCFCPSLVEVRSSIPPSCWAQVLLQPVSNGDYKTSVRTKYSVTN